LNPACCVDGLANQLGIATENMLARTADLFANLASIEQVANGSFYDLLPYSEYLTAVDHVPQQQAFLDAFVARVTSSANEIYQDAAHFWDQILALGDAMTERLSEDLLSSWAKRLLTEQEADGGWPTPYDPAWRPWATTGAVIVLARLTQLETSHPTEI
jgi:hypothetical protein